MAVLRALAAVLLVATAAGQDWSREGRDNPLEFFSLLASMPLEEQRLYLQLAGAQLQEQTHGTCNVFGGSSACQALPADSVFAQKCPNHDLRVDCAYYAEDMAEEVQQDPADRLRKSLAGAGYGDLEKACPQCFENQLALWCYQTVPKCGSFSAAVEGAVLPAMATVTQAQANDRPPLEALSDALPQLMAATDLALPCSQMCEAVVSTCGCQQESKFGPLLDTYLASSDVQAPPGFTQQIFASLYNRPICSLFGNTSAPGFSGHCDTLPMTCTDEARWCGAQKGDSAGMQVQELMAAQLAFALFGWLDAPASSLFQDAASAVSSADDKDAQQLEKQYLVQGPETSSKSSSTWAVVAHTLVAVALVALLAGAAFFVVRRRRRENAWVDGYAAMANDDSAQGFLGTAESGRL